MARIRYLKPDFFKDEDLAILPFEVRLFFAGLWNFADKAGRLEDRPLRLKAEIFPYDDVDIEKCLVLLNKPKDSSGKPFIKRYQIDKEKFIEITNWNKHQKPHHTEKESDIPGPPSMEKGMEKGMGSVEQAPQKLSNGLITVKYHLGEPILYLNEKTKAHYDPKSKANMDLVRARFNEGRTLDQFKSVIDKKVSEWLTDEKMHKYLRPSTLFSRTHFEEYLNAPERGEQSLLDKFEVRR